MVLATDDTGSGAARTPSFGDAEESRAAASSNIAEALGRKSPKDSRGDRWEREVRAGRLRTTNARGR